MLRELPRALLVGLFAAVLFVGPAAAAPVAPPAEPVTAATASAGHWWTRILARLGLVGDGREATSAPAAAPGVTDPRQGPGELCPGPPGKDEGPTIDPIS